jgi:hypothetical protein
VYLAATPKDSPPINFFLLFSLIAICRKFRAWVRGRRIARLTRILANFDWHRRPIPSALSANNAFRLPREGGLWRRVREDAPSVLREIGQRDSRSETRA